VSRRFQKPQSGLAWKVEKNKDSVYFGKRGAGGWKPEGLLWTYTVDKNLPYKPDIDKIVAMN
jgi:hypothetical protein